MHARPTDSSGRGDSARLRALLTGFIPVASLIVLKASESAWVLHAGFSHISDDDYARVTIAEAFAHAPQLDPSGTSWLPFPFWLNGAAMALFGRSLVVARGVAVVGAIAGAVAYYRALVTSGTTARVAWTAVALSMSAPWSVWLGVATVPEAFSASLVAAAALCLSRVETHLWGSLCLLAASLSRYEAWPVALVFAIVCVVSTVRGRGSSDAKSRSTEAAAAVIALIGPLGWLAWNAHAHGDPFHFVARVAAYRLRVAQGSSGSWTLYPAAFARASPGTLAFFMVGSFALGFDPALRRRWIGPLLAIAALLAFLVEGDLHDGAPTHHPERALVAVFWLGTAFGVDGLRSLAVRFVWARPKREAWLVGCVVALALAGCLVWPSRVADYPARSLDEDRTVQLARGEDLRARDVAHVDLTPCAYEHFATIAAFGAPERATIEPQATGTEGPCPRIEER